MEDNAYEGHPRAVRGLGKDLAKKVVKTVAKEAGKAVVKKVVKKISGWTCVRAEEETHLQTL